MKSKNVRITFSGQQFFFLLFFIFFLHFYYATLQILLILNAEIRWNEKKKVSAFFITLSIITT